MKFISFKTVSALSFLFLAMGSLSEAVPQKRQAKAKPAKANQRGKKQVKPAAKPVSKPKPLAKPNPKPASKPNTAPKKETLAKVEALFKSFVDMNNQNLSWACFTKKLANTLSVDAKYKPFVDELKKLEKETKIPVIQSRLEKYKHLIPEESLKLLNQYNSFQMLNILTRRVLNKNNQC